MNGGVRSPKFRASVSEDSRPGTIPGVCGVGDMDLSLNVPGTLSQHLWFIKR